MTVHVRSRKYHEVFNCGFDLRDGTEKVYNLSQFCIGDKVNIMRNITPRQFEEIQNMEHVGLRAYGGAPNDYHIILPFRIVEREHYFGDRGGGKLSLGGSQIYLEAENGYWEDVYLWLFEGKIPKWAAYDEQA